MAPKEVINDVKSESIGMAAAGSKRSRRRWCCGDGGDDRPANHHRRVGGRTRRTRGVTLRNICGESVRLGFFTKSGPTRKNSRGRQTVVVVE